MIGENVAQNALSKNRARQLMGGSASSRSSTVGAGGIPITSAHGSMRLMTGMTGMGRPGVGRSHILCGKTQITTKAGVTAEKDVLFQVRKISLLTL